MYINEYGNPDNHCNVGNGKLVVDEILEWISRIDGEKKQLNH